METKEELLRAIRIDRSAVREAADRRVWLWALLLIIVLGIAGSLVWHSHHVPRESAVISANVPASPAFPDVPHSGSLLDASGYVVAQRQATVSAKVIGRVVEVLIEEGHQVTKGDVVARLDDSSARATYAQTRAILGQAMATLDATNIAYSNAQPIFERSKRQMAAGVISAQDFDIAKSTFEAIQADVAVSKQGVDVAQSGVLVAKQGLEDTVVRAPFSGVVTVKAAQPGEIVSPASAGGAYTRSGICTIVDMDSLAVEVEVGEGFIGRVHVGQPVRVRLNAYPDWVINSEVVVVIPSVDRSKATVKVRIEIKERDARILPDMGARVSFFERAASEAR